jgi:CheY-like chemotaxis protein
MLGKNKILLVDDDPEDRSIIDDGFSAVGAEGIAHYEENGETALQYLESSFQAGNLPCLVVLDLNMPRLNGTQTLKAIKTDERFKNIAVLIYSTSLNPFEKEECMLLGAQSYIIKPISYAESLRTAEYFRDVCLSKISNKEQGILNDEV